MEHSNALLFAFLIGVVAGLRALTAPAVTSWAAHLHWLNLADSPLRFMASIITVVIFTILACVELVADQLPSTPARTKPGGSSRASFWEGCAARRWLPLGDNRSLSALFWARWAASPVRTRATRSARAS